MAFVNKITSYILFVNFYIDNSFFLFEYPIFSKYRLRVLLIVCSLFCFWQRLKCNVMFIFVVFVTRFIPFNVLLDPIVRGMTPPHEKVHSLWQFIDTKSITQTQKSLMERSSTDNQYFAVVKEFLETGSALTKKSPGSPCTN